MPRHNELGPDPERPYLTESAGPGRWIGRAALVATAAGALYIAGRAGVEAYQFVDENQLMVGAAAAGTGFGAYKYSEKLTKRGQRGTRRLMHNAGVVLMAGGGLIAAAEVRSGLGEDDAPDSTTTTFEESPEAPGSGSTVMVDESGNVITITIPQIEGMSCTDFAPETVEPNDTVTGIIQYQQGYDANQLADLYEAAPEIGALHTIRPGQVIDVNCAAG